VTQSGQTALDSNVEWTSWLDELADTAAATLQVELVGRPVPGLQGRTIGAQVRGSETDQWLRVVTEPPGWGFGALWTGNFDANQVTSVPHPKVHEVKEWDDSPTGRRVRAELMGLAPGSAIAADMVLRAPVTLDESWWRQLGASLTALATQPTERECLGPELLTRRLLAGFGVVVDLRAVVWSTAHGDLHWANLTNPGCWILDWETWGSAPAGYDAALLHAASLLQPEIAHRVRQTFAEILDGPGGAIAQLAAAAKMLRLVEHGHHQDLAVPLHRHVRELIAIECLGGA